MRLLRGAFLSATLCLTFATGARAQASSTKGAQQVGENDVLRVTTSLVKIPVAVKDSHGRYVVDLRKDDFRVYEGSAERQIAYFGSVDEPVSVVLLIDVSCSIRKPEDTVAAAMAFVDQLRPTDSVLPVTFGSSIRLLLDKPTSDRAVLRESLQGLPDGKLVPCEGGTRLGDAVEFVLTSVLKESAGRRAVILLTDGRDSTMSKPGWGPRTFKEVSELGVPFYSIRLWGRLKPVFSGWAGDSSAENLKWKFSAADLDGYIDDLAKLSGGRYYPISTGESLRTYFEQIGEELRHQYVLAYYADNSKEKQERRKLKVRVNRQNVSVRARESYLYVPPGK